MRFLRATTMRSPLVVIGFMAVTSCVFACENSIPSQEPLRLQPGEFSPECTLVDGVYQYWRVTLEGDEMITIETDVRRIDIDGGASRFFGVPASRYDSDPDYEPFDDPNPTFSYAVTTSNISPVQVPPGEYIVCFFVRNDPMYTFALSVDVQSTSALSSGAIAGIVIGVTAFLILLVLALRLHHKRALKRAAEEAI